ncbi:MAG TPA: hypothetical protein VI540_06510 [Gaiellaceae bacterium]|nr:hypothetical protein [Gaiellaceae bacterium]
MLPIDPGGHWLEAGITGLARQREWDAVATSDAPGSAGDEVEFVALADGRLLVNTDSGGAAPESLAAALEGAIDRPYRAFAVRRPELWTVGATAIETAELSFDRGDEFELVRGLDETSLRIDGMPTAEAVPELERIGEARSATYVVRARRLTGAVFEIEVEPL